MNNTLPKALCKKCRTWKPKTLFNRYASGRLIPYCPECYVPPNMVLNIRYSLLRAHRASLLIKGFMDCTDCGKEKPLDRFPKGGNHTCKKCLARNSLHYYYSMTVNQRRVRQRSAWNNMIKDPAVKLRYALRSRMTQALRQSMTVKRESSALIVGYIGCSIAELKSYLQQQFKPGMTWENHGVHGWHIDHVMPLNGFNLINDKDIKRAWHYTNLRPLWAKENLRKHDKKLIQHQPLLMLLSP